MTGIIHRISFQLDRREIEVLRWLSLGKRNEEIAQIMSLNDNHIRQITYRIRDKLGANTSAGAVGIALRRGLIT